MTHRRAALLIALLFAAAWAGGGIRGNPTTFRPQALATSNLTRPLGQRGYTSQPRSTRRAAPHAPPTVVALRGITVQGDIFDLPIPLGLRLTDPLPVPPEPLADLEIDLDDGSTITVALEDPDAAAEAGAVVVADVSTLPVEVWVAVTAKE